MRVIDDRGRISVDSLPATTEPAPSEHHCLDIEAVGDLQARIYVDALSVALATACRTLRS